MKQLIFIFLLFSSCSTDVGVIEEPKAGAPELELTMFRKDYDVSTDLRYEAACNGCEFMVEGQTLSYKITNRGSIKADRFFPNRGQFGCYSDCESSFVLAFSNNYFDIGEAYEIVVSYTLPDTDCFDATVIRNRFEFTY